MWQLLTSLDAWAALVSLTALEIVLGVDNVIFISVLVSRLDARRGETARRLGLALAVVFRIALLFALTSLLGLSGTVFTLWGNWFSWHDLILIFGDLFLIAKATHELHAQIESQLEEANPAGGSAGALPARASTALVALVADGFDVHIPRGYVYFAMAFAAAVEAFNI
jgi:predicted tellurium resistance membrane protein TerC